MRTLLFSALAILSSSAWAQEGRPGSYLGLSLGQLDYEEEAFGTTLEDTALAYKLYGGYRFGDTWAVEASYGQTSSLKWSESGTLPGFGSTTATLSGDYDVLEVRGLAHLGVFLVGLGYWDADLKATLSVTSTLTGPMSVSASDSDSGASLILGGQWSFDTWSLRAEYEYFDTESTVDAYTLGVGVHFRF